MGDAREVDRHHFRRSKRGERRERTVHQKTLLLSEGVHTRGGLQIARGKLETNLLLGGRVGRLDEEQVGECVLRCVLLLHYPLYAIRT